MYTDVYLNYNNDSKYKTINDSNDSKYKTIMIVNIK